MQSTIGCGSVVGARIAETCKYTDMTAYSEGLSMGSLVTSNFQSGFSGPPEISELFRVEIKPVWGLGFF